MIELFAQTTTSRAITPAQPPGADLQTVLTFYNVALTHLEWLVAAVLAIVAIFVPILLYLMSRFRIKKIETRAVDQASKLRATFDAIVAELKKQNERAITTAVDQSREKFQEVIKASTAEMNKPIAHTRAGVFHVQAVMHVNNHCYAASGDSCSAACLAYISSEDFTGLQRILKVLCDNCLPHTDKTDFVKFPTYAPNCSKLIKSLYALDDKGAFFDQAQNLERHFEQAESREPPPPNPPS